MSNKILFFILGVLGLISGVVLYKKIHRKVVMQGQVIIFDGASSAGKSSVIKQLMPMLDTSFCYIAVDDFVSELFLEQQKRPLPEAEFLARIRESCDVMYAKIRALVAEGRNVVLDTVLSGLEGEKSVQYTLKQLENLPLSFVLMHCPLRVLVERINQRNKKALQEHNPKDVRSIGTALSQFGHIYMPRKNETEVFLGVLSRNDVEHACEVSKKEFAGDGKRFESFKEWLLAQLGVKDKEMVTLTTRLPYDYIVDTSKHTPHECALKIKAILSGKMVVTSTGVQLYSETFGNQTDPAILLISGAMASARGWSDTFCTHLADKGFFVIRYDHRDTGLSSSIDYAKNPYDLNDLVNDIVAILDAYKINKAHLVGHSVGGTLAQLCTIKHPDRCSSITIISGKTVEEPTLSEKEQAQLKKTWDILLANKPTLSYEESLDGFLKSYKHLSGTLPFDEDMAKADVKDMYERSKHMYLTPDGQVKAFEVPHNHVKAQEKIDVTKNDLQKITTPILIIHGQEDYIALPVNAKITAQAMPNSKLIIIPGMGHMMFNRKLEKQIADLVLEHIRKIKK